MISKAFRIKWYFHFCSNILQMSWPLLCCTIASKSELRMRTEQEGDSDAQGQITRKRQKTRETDPGRKREWETKERVTEQWEVYAVCQHKASKMSVFVLHQWVMAAIIPPNGFKQAILAQFPHPDETGRVLHSGDTQTQHGKWSVKACEAWRLVGRDIKRLRKEKKEVKRDEKEQVSPHTKDDHENASVKNRGREEIRIKKPSAPVVFRCSCSVLNMMVSLNIDRTVWSDINWTKWLRQIWRFGALQWDAHNESCNYRTSTPH